MAILCRQQSPIAMHACMQLGAKLMDFHRFLSAPLFRSIAYACAAVAGNLAVLAKRLK